MDPNRDDLLNFISKVPHHDLSMIFDALELALSQIDFDSVEEKALLEQFMVSFWVATKRE